MAFPRRRPLASVLLLLALALASLLVSGGHARGHALLVSSDPSFDARLQAPPARITAVFSEPIAAPLSSLFVLDADGARQDTGSLALDPADPRQVSVEMRRDLPPGYYTVAWRAFSGVDGHVLAGSYPFTVLAGGREPGGSPPPVPAVGVAGGTPTAAAVAVRWLLYLAALTMTGGAAFLILVMGPVVAVLPADARLSAWQAALRRWRRSTVPLAVVLGVAGLLELWLQLRQMEGAGAAGATLATRWGMSWVTRQAALGVFAAGLLAPTTRRARTPEMSRWLLRGVAAAGVAYLLLMAGTSHAAAIDGWAWAMALDGAHLAAGAVWTGALLQLLLLLAAVRRGGEDTLPPDAMVPLMRRFSAAAGGALAVLLLTGLAGALSEVTAVSEIGETAYGRTLALKLAVAVPLLAVVAANAYRFRATSRRRDGLAAAEAARRRPALALLGAEIALIAVVLGASAALAQRITPQQLALVEDPLRRASGQGFEARGRLDDVAVDLSVTPNAPGINTFQVRLGGAHRDADAEVLRVRLELTSPDPAMGPTRVEAERLAPGVFGARGPYLTRPGRWQVTADILRREIDDLSVSFPVDVPGPVLVPGARAFSPPWPQGGAIMLATAIGLAAAGGVAIAGAGSLPRRRPARRLYPGGAAAAGLLLIAGVFAAPATTQGQPSARPGPAALSAEDRANRAAGVVVALDMLASPGFHAPFSALDWALQVDESDKDWARTAVAVLRYTDWPPETAALAATLERDAERIELALADGDLARVRGGALSDAHARAYELLDAAFRWLERHPAGEGALPGPGIPADSMAAMHLIDHAGLDLLAREAEQTLRPGPLAVLKARQVRAAARAVAWPRAVRRDVHALETALDAFVRAAEAGDVPTARSAARDMVAAQRNLSRAYHGSAPAEPLPQAGPGVASVVGAYAVSTAPLYLVAERLHLGLPLTPDESAILDRAAFASAGVAWPPAAAATASDLRQGIADLRRELQSGSLARAADAGARAEASRRALARAAFVELSQRR